MKWQNKFSNKFIKKLKSQKFKVDKWKSGNAKWKSQENGKKWKCKRGDRKLKCKIYKIIYKKN